MAGPDGNDPSTAADWVERLSSLMTQAGEVTDPAQLSGLLADIQRVTGWALRAAVGEARESGVSWRELAPHLGVPFGTLHRQYQAGGGLQIVRPGADDLPPEVGDGPRLERGEAEPTPEPEPAPEPERAPERERAPEPDRPDAASGAPAVAARRLPAALDSFIGRDTELADLSRLLGRSRLVTVTGPAGAGKTRLVLEAARRVQRSFDDQAWLVELAAVPSPDLVVQTVAAGLGVTEQAGQPLLDTVAVAIGQRRALLVLDNCEHLVDACALLVEALLRRCAGLRVLTTSREALQIEGEAVVVLEPLPVPDLGAPVERAALLRSDAVRLFLDRARAGVPDFELTATTGPAVAAICVHLDGLPLAIELATRRLRMLPPDQLLAHLEDRFHLLVMPRRQTAGRQHSLYAAIDWSHGLLTAAERTVFRRIAVFAGGFDLPAATAVCAGDGITHADVLDALTNLEAKSLLTATQEGRYRQLESIRMYGRDQLDDSGEKARVHHRLLDWLTTLAEPLTRVVSLRASIERPLMSQQENLAHAVGWAIEHDDDRQVLLAVALAKCWRQQGYPAQAVPLLERVLPHRAASPVHRAVALGEAGFLATRAGDHERGRRLGMEMLAIAQQIGDDTIHAKALLIVGSACEESGDLSAAVTHYRERLEVTRKLAAPTQAAMAMNDLSWCLLQIGALDEAEPLLHEALVLLGPDQSSMHSSVRHSLAALALIRRDPATAERRLRQNLRLPNQDADEVAYDVEGLLIVFAQRRQADRALRLAGAVQRVRSELGMQAEPWWQRLTDEGVTAARRLVPAAKAAAAIKAGSRLTLEQAVAYALELHPGEDGSSSRERALLTAREQQVAALVARGLTNLQIAHRLSMSERTVVSHLEHIRTKLDLPSRAQIAVWAAEQERVDN